MITISKEIRSNTIKSIVNLTFVKLRNRSDVKSTKPLFSELAQTFACCLYSDDGPFFVTGKIS